MGTSADHSLPSEDVQRYSRQIIVKEFGVGGQENLSKAAVLIVGAGGLGCPVATYLATSGVGRVGVVDYDVIAIDNIHRQFQYSEESVGRSKAEELCRVLEKVNSKTTLTPHVEMLTPENAHLLIKEYDIVADCSDNPETRYLVNDVCVLMDKPLVSGSALQWEGQLTVYNNGKNCPCYRCVFPNRPTAESVTNCSDGGVLGPVVGVVGSMQALEIIKVAAGMTSSLTGSMWVYDGLAARVRTIRLRQRDPKCAVCGENPTITSTAPSSNLAVCTSEFCEKTMPVSLLPNSERISCNEYNKLRKNSESLRLIDTRPRNEFAIGRLKEAINIPFDELNKKTKEELVELLGNTSGEEVFLVCRRGNDSQRAVVNLREKFTDEKINFTDLIEPPGFLQTTLVDAALGLDARSPPDDVNGGLRTELHSRSPPSRSRFTDTRHDAQHEMLRMLRSGGVTRCIARACSSAATDAKSSAENTVLSRFIKDKIKVSGPITVHEYMQMCIGSPSVGYYSQFSRQGSEIFGDKGDFITAPELCQMFGEMIGIWCFYELGYTGHRGAWQLVECGPGTGQLMNDVVGVLNMFQEDKVSIHLVETSDSLILEQERTLCAKPSEFIEGLPHVRYNKTRSGMEVYWYRSVDDVPGDKFSVFIANEFLDALPIHQFRRNDKGRWSEVYVNLDSKGELCFMLSKNENLHTKGLIPDSVRDEKSLIEWEISPFSGMFVNQVAERICSHGGFAVLVDYGHDNTRKNLSLRAYHKHGETNPLERCGEQDLTADVNFGHLKSLVEDRTVVYGPVDQREFLAQLGIGLRLRKLVEQLKTRDEQEALIKSYNMLMSEEGMGTKFKAMAMYPQTLKNILEKRGGPVGFASSKRNLKEETTK